MYVLGELLLCLILRLLFGVDVVVNCYGLSVFYILIDVKFVLYLVEGDFDVL